LILDGEIVNGNMIPDLNDGKEHTVVAELG
jgi:hypothetical protein